ncbi:MAG: c-type cytochrome [Fischerella sp.]|nr:c-type cytochrome [Fischerella sp.]
MKILLLILLLAIALLNFTFIDPALAAETSEASKATKIFNSNCASCHIGGGNILIAEKTLKKQALQHYLKDYDTNPIQAIIAQIQNGKNAMPAFKSKLSEQEILEVAAYVFQKAEQGW